MPKKYIYKPNILSFEYGYNAHQGTEKSAHFGQEKTKIASMLPNYTR